jgi:DNA modification methylase
MNKIYLGDCISVLRTFENKSIDITFTSPPFKPVDIGMSEEDYWKWYNIVYNEIIRVTSKIAIIIYTPTRINYIMQNYPPKRLLIWGKQTTRFYAASWRYNPIFVYQLNNAYNINKYIWTDTFAVAPIRTKDKIHPYEDPLLLYETILKMFKGCNTVLDPFMGIGTSMLACNKSNKDFIGIEINEEYFNIAKNRAEETQIVK